MRHTLVLATYFVLVTVVLAGCDKIEETSDTTGYFDEAMRRSPELQTALRQRLRHTQGEYSVSGHQADFRPEQE